MARSFWMTIALLLTLTGPAEAQLFGGGGMIVFDPTNFGKNTITAVGTLRPGRWSERLGARTRLVATLKSSRRGGFSYRAPKGVSRNIQFRYAGTATIAA